MNMELGETNITKKSGREEYSFRTKQTMELSNKKCPVIKSSPSELRTCKRKKMNDNSPNEGLEWLSFVKKPKNITFTTDESEESNEKFENKSLRNAVRSKSRNSPMKKYNRHVFETVESPFKDTFENTKEHYLKFLNGDLTINSPWKNSIKSANSSLIELSSKDDAETEQQHLQDLYQKNRQGTDNKSLVTVEISSDEDISSDEYVETRKQRRNTYDLKENQSKILNHTFELDDSIMNEIIPSKSNSRNNTFEIEEFVHNKSLITIEISSEEDISLDEHMETRKQRRNTYELTENQSKILNPTLQLNDSEMNETNIAKCSNGNSTFEIEEFVQNHSLDRSKKFSGRGKNTKHISENANESMVKKKRKRGTYELKDCEARALNHTFDTYNTVEVKCEQLGKQDICDKDCDKQLVLPPDPILELNNSKMNETNLAKCSNGNITFEIEEFVQSEGLDRSKKVLGKGKNTKHSSENANESMVKKKRKRGTYELKDCEARVLNHTFDTDNTVEVKREQLGKQDICDKDCDKQLILSPDLNKSLQKKKQKRSISNLDDCDVKIRINPLNESKNKDNSIASITLDNEICLNKQQSDQTEYAYKLKDCKTKINKLKRQRTFEKLESLKNDENDETEKTRDFINEMSIDETEFETFGERKNKIQTSKEKCFKEVDEKKNPDSKRKILFQEKCLRNNEHSFNKKNVFTPKKDQCEKITDFSKDRENLLSVEIKNSSINKDKNKKKCTFKNANSKQSVIYIGDTANKSSCDDRYVITEIFTTTFNNNDCEKPKELLKDCLGSNISVDQPGIEYLKPNFINNISTNNITNTSYNSSKKIKTNKLSSRKKMPNFALIHQKQFERMENIEQYSQRKNDRARLLLSGNKPKVEIMANELKLNRKPDEKNVENLNQFITKRKCNKELEFFDSKNATVSTPKIITLQKNTNFSPSPIKNSVLKYTNSQKNVHGLKNTNPLNQFSFKLNNDGKVKKDPKTNNKVLKQKLDKGRNSPLPTKSNSGINLIRKTKLPVQVNNLKQKSVEKNSASQTKMIVEPKSLNKHNMDKGLHTRFGFKMMQKPSREEMKTVINKTVNVKNTVKERRDLIQGVRSNRRFDLLMKMRNK